MDTTDPAAHRPHPLTRHLGSLALVAALVLLAVAQEVLVPIALAALLAVLLTPLVKWLARHGLPDLLAVLLVVGAGLVVTASVGWLILGQVNDLAARVPEYRENLHQRLSDLRAKGSTVAAVASTVQDLRSDLAADAAKAPPPPAGGATATGAAMKEDAPAKAPAVEKPHESKPEKREPVLVTIDERHTPGFAELSAIATSSLRPLALAVMTVLLATVMMAQRVDLERRFVALLAHLAGGGTNSLSARSIDEITGRITRYLVMQSLFNLVAGTIVAVALLLLGLPNPLLWGLMTAVLRFVPYVGILLVTCLTVVFAVAVSPDWNLPLMVLGLFAAVEMLIGNVAEPLLFGQGAGLSTLAVLVATAFWTWIWGLPGLVLAIPLTVCLVALGRHVESLGYLNILLAKEPPGDGGGRRRAVDGDGAAA